LAAVAIALVLGGLLGGCTSGTTAVERVRVITLTIEHSKFHPAEVRVEPGERVRFIVVNDDPIDHELIVGDAAVQERHERGSEPDHGAVPGEVSIPAGTTRTTDYTFGETGDLIFGCHLPGHYDYGMRGRIVIAS